VYHSMCMEGFYGAIPGLTIVAPSTSRDVYGLLRTAAEYTGPVLFFESKGLYRMTLGDAFPGEPSDPEEIRRLKRAIGFEGHAPDLPDDFRVPLGKAARLQEGSDLTLVTWGRCTLFCQEAVQQLATEDGVSVDLIDLRTIVPPDLPAVFESVGRTGRLLVVHEDRVFSSLGRELQGAVHEQFGERHVITRVLGQDAVPGVPQSVVLEDLLVVSPEKVVAAARSVLQTRISRGAAPVAAPPQVLWTPNRNFVA
jgi:2-oxoisovalerate dehydrogenase E1 component